MLKLFQTSDYKKTFREIIQFLKTDLWRIQTSKVSRGKAFLLKTLRVLILATRGFEETQCMLRASALTLFTILSIVPILALGFGVSKGFGLEKNLKSALKDKFLGQEELFDKLFEFSMASLKNTRGDIIAGVGLLVLFFVVMRVLHNIEETFNAIWKVKKHRSIVRKLTDYLAIMIITPILIVFSSSITVYIHTELQDITRSTGNILSFLDPILLMSYDLIPLGLIWLLLSLNFMIIPNTHVNVESALLAGFITAIAYQVTQWAYIKFQVGVAGYNAIYGSFAALPLFLIWLQTSWIIILYGAEIAFAHQNSYKYEFEKDTLRLSIDSRKRLSILVSSVIIKGFKSGKPPFTLHEISEELGIPQRFAELALDELDEAGIILETYLRDKKQPVFLPAKDINILTSHFIAQAIESKGVDAFELLNLKESGVER